MKNKQNNRHFLNLQRNAVGRIISIALCAALLSPLAACKNADNAAPAVSDESTASSKASETKEPDKVNESTVTSESSTASESSVPVSESVASESSEKEESVSSPDSSEPTESSETESTESLTEETFSFSVPTSAFTEKIDDDFVSLAEQKGVKVSRTEDTIVFTVPKSAGRNVTDDYKKRFEKDDETSSESTIKKIKINDSFDVVEFYVTDEFEDSMDSLAILVFPRVVSYLQLFSEKIKSEDDVRYTNRIINMNTNEVISEGIIPDDLSKAASE